MKPSYQQSKSKELWRNKYCPTTNTVRWATKNNPLNEFHIQHLCINTYCGHLYSTPNVL